MVFSFPPQTIKKIILLKIKKNLKIKGK
jgi:hypothetical protein